MVQPDKNPIANANAENLTIFFLHNVTSSVNQNLPIPEQLSSPLLPCRHMGEFKADCIPQYDHPLTPIFSIQPYKLNGISIPALAPTSSLSLLLALVYQNEVFKRTD